MHDGFPLAALEMVGSQRCGARKDQADYEYLYKLLRCIHVLPQITFWWILFKTLSQISLLAVATAFPKPAVIGIIAQFYMGYPFYPLIASFVLSH